MTALNTGAINAFPLNGEVAGDATGVTGELNAVLGSLTTSGIGAVAVSGTTSATLDSATVTATATVQVVAELTSTLSGISSESSASVAIQGASSTTLGDVVLVSTGEVASSSTNGQVNATLGSVTVESQTAVEVTGSLSGTLGDVVSEPGASVLPVEEVRRRHGGGSGNSSIQRRRTRLQEKPSPFLEIVVECVVESINGEKPTELILGTKKFAGVNEPMNIAISRLTVRNNKEFFAECYLREVVNSEIKSFSVECSLIPPVQEAN